MAAVWQDDGINQTLNTLRNATVFTTAKMHLYQNNYTPLVTSVLADFTESTFTGYASQTLATWGAVSVAAHVASSLATALTFTLTGGSAQSIYGYFVTNSAGTLLLCAERDPNAPFSISVTANTYQVTAQATMQSA